MTPTTTTATSIASSASSRLLLTVLLLTATASNAELEAPTVDSDVPQYGFDCSFPIFQTDLTNCAADLGDKTTFYNGYIDGCRDMYGEICDTNEADRIAMNLRQPHSMLNFTKTGFMKIKAPDNVRKLIKEFWAINKNERTEEEWYEGNVYTNHWDIPTEFVSILDEELEGGGPELADAIWDAAQTTIEEWTGMRQRPSSIYGIRVYNEGAVLSPHCDRMPLISSAIVNVAQDVDEDWPIEVYGHDGIAVNITMEPGDMVLYESGTIIHGRPFPLKGRFYANIFIHFEPVGFMDGRPFINSEDLDLPPYLKAGSPEADFQHENFIDSNQITDRVDLEVHTAAGDGDLEQLIYFAQRDSTQLHFKDPNGWQPIHEASRMGQTEAVKYLVENRANYNSRTDFGNGLSPLSLAIKHNGADHELVHYLEGLGAEAHYWEPHYDKDEDEEEDGDEEEEDEDDEEDEEDEDEDEDEEDDEDELEQDL